MRVAICDDEKACRDIVVKFISLFEENNLKLDVSEFNSGKELIAAYKSNKKYDIIFLDVEMPEMSGVETGKIIREIDNNALFIFVTGYMKYVPDAFRLNSFQFLVKPLEQKVFDEEFNRAVQTYRRMKTKYKISYKGLEKNLEIREIIRIGTVGRYLSMLTNEGEHKYWGNISAEEKKLSTHDFVRCHRGYIVNMHYVKKIDKNAFILLNGDEIAISKYLKTQVVEKYNKFISGCYL